MADTACKQLIRYSFVGRQSRFIVIQAQIHRLDMRIVLQHLKQNLIGNRAGRRIAVLLPVASCRSRCAFKAPCGSQLIFPCPYCLQSIRFLHGNKRERIYRRFKQIQLVAFPGPVKTVFWQTAAGVAFVTALRTCTSFVRVLWVPVCIIADKNHIVVRCGFIHHFTMHKSIQHVPVNAAAVY